MAYNPDSLNYNNYKFKYMTLEDMSQEKPPIHQDHPYFSVLFSE